MSYRDLESRWSKSDPGVRSGYLLLAVLLGIIGLVAVFLFSVVLAPPRYTPAPAPSAATSQEDELMPGDEIAAPDESLCGLKILDRLPRNRNLTPTSIP